MRLTWLAFLLTPALALAAGFEPKPAQDFLPVDQAFELQPVESKDGELLVGWRVTPGHFLYRARLEFRSKTPGLKLGAAKLPQGKPYQDELLGDTEIYDSDLRLRLPASGAGTLKITWQGCAKKGLCYPPQTREVPVAVAAAPKKKT